MDASDLIAKFELEEKTTVLVYNPLPYDVDWVFDGQKQKPIPSKENVKLKPSLAKIAGDLIVDLYIASKENYSREKAERLVYDRH